MTRRLTRYCELVCFSFFFHFTSYFYTFILYQGLQEVEGPLWSLSLSLRSSSDKIITILPTSNAHKPPYRAHTLVSTCQPVNLTYHTFPKHAETHLLHVNLHVNLMSTSLSGPIAASSADSDVQIPDVHQEVGYLVRLT